MIRSRPAWSRASTGRAVTQPDGRSFLAATRRRNGSTCCVRSCPGFLSSGRSLIRTSRPPQISCVLSKRPPRKLAGAIFVAKANNDAELDAAFAALLRQRVGAIRSTEVSRVHQAPPQPHPQFVHFGHPAAD